MVTFATITSTRSGKLEAVEVNDIEEVMMAAERAADEEYSAGHAGIIRIKATAKFPARGGVEYGYDVYVVECVRGQKY